MVLTGSCSCKAVTYEISLEEAKVAICHCTSCQSSSGSTYSTNLVVPADTLSVSGAVKTWQHKGGSGAMLLNTFCGTCASTLFSQTEAASMAGMRFVKAGTLDDKAWLSGHQPDMEIYRQEGMEWAGNLVQKV